MADECVLKEHVSEYELNEEREREREKVIKAFCACSVGDVRTSTKGEPGPIL